MLRKLILCLLVLVALIPIVNALPEEAPTITVEMHYEEGGSFEYKYDRSNNEWVWKPTLAEEFGQRISFRFYQKSLQEELATYDEEKGYMLLESYQAGSPQEGLARVTTVPKPSTGEASYLERYYDQQEAEEIKKKGETTSAREERCGDNGEYLKLCYYEQSIHPYNPLRNQRAIAQFASRAEREGLANQGYLLFVFTPEDANKGTTDKPARLLQARMHALKTAADEAISSLGLGSKKVITSGFISPAPGDRPRAAYLIPDTQTENDVTIPVIQSIYAGDYTQEPISPYQAALEVMNSATSIEEAHRKQWQAQMDEFTGNDELLELSDRLEERTGIRTFLLATDGEWITDNQLQLHEQIRDKAQENPKLHPMPCANYLLLDEQGIKLYESTYCRLRFDPIRLQVQDPVEQAELMLRSAIRNTPPIQEEQLFVAAYGFAEQYYGSEDEEEILPGTQPGVQLAAWLADKENTYLTDQNLKQRNASAEIVFARNDLTQTNYVSALTNAKIYTQDAHPRMRILGAQTALKAADLLDDCEEIRDVMNRFSGILDGRSGTYRTAQQTLRSCQYRIAREQCELVEESQHGENPIGDLEILYVNDQLDEDIFAEYTERITEDILSIENLNDYASDIVFRRAPSINQVTRPQNDLRAPRIDHRAVKQTTNACYGDATIVLSDNYYLPVNDRAGNTYMGVQACGESFDCVTRYVLRGLAVGVFQMEPVPGSASANIQVITPQNVRRSNPEDGILKVFTVEQREIIREYFGDDADE